MRGTASSKSASLGGLPQTAHGGVNAAAAARDLEVRHARRAQLVFGVSRRAEHRVRVRVHEAGRQQSAITVHFTGRRERAP
jgi:hypothetical protein